jgi:hypothetical protein
MAIRALYVACKTYAARAARPKPPGGSAHIAAMLLSHLNLDTTRGYTAVFPEQVIAAHHHFIEQRHEGGLRARRHPSAGESAAATAAGAAGQRYP